MTAHPPTHLLRVEGVNLDNFVLDTRDLSTVRGGSLLLLDAIKKQVTAILSNPPSGLTVANVKPLSLGASAGVFLLDTPDPDCVRDAILNDLRSTPPFCHATFAADIIPYDPSKHQYRLAIEKLRAMNRWRQMQGCSLALPPKQSATAVPSKPACGLNGLHPAVAGSGHTLRGNQLSQSVFDRRKKGSQAKQDFYREITALDIEGDFANEFEQIAGKTEHLPGKMAVFYADGNSFGQQQRTLCDSPEKQALWDHLIQSKRVEFLKEFLTTEATAKAEWQNGSKIRFETLLWGGDELMFVMPAALGWRFATLFFKKLGNVLLSTATLPHDSPFADLHPSFSSNNALTHSAALVFCHHHAPIHRIKHLAKEQMVEFAKEQSRDRDQLVVTALESFDHLGNGFDVWCRTRYGSLISAEDLILRAPEDSALADSLGSIAQTIQDLHESSAQFARSQLRWLVASHINAGSGGFPDIDTVFSKQTNGAFRNASPGARNTVEKVRSALPADLPAAALWIHLEELWDYARP